MFCALLKVAAYLLKVAAYQKTKRDLTSFIFLGLISASPAMYAVKKNKKTKLIEVSEVSQVSSSYNFVWNCLEWIENNFAKLLPTSSKLF